MSESLELANPINNNISIRLSTDGFSFVVSDAAGSRRESRTWAVNPQRSMAANVKAFLAENEQLRRRYRQTDILVHSPRYTVMPLALYEDEQAEAVFYQNVTRANNENVLCNVLGKSSLVVLFSIDKLTHQFIIDNFPSARIFASVSPQLEEFTSRCKGGQGCSLYADIHSTDMDVMCFRDGRLQLVNSYSAATADDRCYYLAGVWSRLGLDSSSDSLHLTGDETLCDEVRGVMGGLVANVTREACALPFDLESLIDCE